MREDIWLLVEDINYRAMSQSLHFDKATMANAFGKFLQFLSYKLEDRGKVLGKVDKWLPSSKTCNHCKVINHNLQLSDKTWVCPNCGTLIDRDYNAALNIKEEGLRLYA